MRDLIYEDKILVMNRGVHAHTYYIERVDDKKSDEKYNSSYKNDITQEIKYFKKEYFYRIRIHIIVMLRLKILLMFVY